MRISRRLLVFLVLFAVSAIVAGGNFTDKSKAFELMDQPYSHVWVSQNVYPTLAVGQSYNFQVTVRNTGTQTWQRGAVNLGTSHERDRISGFTREGSGPSGWISPNRIWFQESAVAPGQTATYSFWMRNDGASPGTYREYFQLVADGVSWMEDYGIYWDIKSPTEQEKYRHAWVSQNVYPTLYLGQSYNFQVRVRNTGVATWQRGRVNLGTSHGQDRISGFTREGSGPSGWISPNRIWFQESSVAPGQTATFSFYMRNDGVPAGRHREYFQLVADGITWMEDYGIYWEINAISSSPPATPTPTPTPTPSPTPTPAAPGHCLNMNNYSAPPAISNFPYDTTYDDQQAFSSPEYEPSGLVYVPDYDSIFMVDDGGYIVRLSTDLDVLNAYNVTGDLEGITYDPSTDKIYTIYESPRTLSEFVYNEGTEELTAGRTWDLSSLISCDAANTCLEALTFVPVENDEGGVFYVGNQEDGVITVVEVPLVTEPAFDPRTYGDDPTIDPPTGISGDISGLYYHPVSTLVYAIFDTSNRMSTLDTATNAWSRNFYLPSHSVAGATENEEAITFDSNCSIYIGEDTIGANSYGRVRRFDQ